MRRTQGVVWIDLEIGQTDKKSISNTRTFDSITVTDYTVLEETISNHAAQCAAELRKQKSCAVSLMVFIHTNPRAGIAAVLAKHGDDITRATARVPLRSFSTPKTR